MLGSQGVVSELALESCLKRRRSEAGSVVRVGEDTISSMVLPIFC
jgi:hypothetical protein